jgi:hypothetical protein
MNASVSGKGLQPWPDGERLIERSAGKSHVDVLRGIVPT